MVRRNAELLAKKPVQALIPAQVDACRIHDHFCLHAVSVEKVDRLRRDYHGVAIVAVAPADHAHQPLRETLA